MTIGVLKLKDMKIMFCIYYNNIVLWMDMNENIHLNNPSDNVPPYHVHVEHILKAT